MSDGVDDEPWPLWEDSAKWPLAPAGFVFLADALQRVLGRGFDDRLWRDNYRRPETIRWLHHLIANAHLSCVFRDEQNGELIPLGCSDWNREFPDIEERFRTCLYRARVPEEVRRLLPAQWPCGMGSIFVSYGSLMHLLRALPAAAREHLGARQANNASPAAKQTVLAERRAEAWLRAEFVKTETVGKAKGTFKTEAKGLFQGLGENAFERAWGQATADHSERRSAGRKKAGSETPQ